MKELLKRWWLEERRKFRRLTWRERFQYIRQYYTLWILGIIVVLVAAYVGITSLGNLRNLIG